MKTLIALILVLVTTSALANGYCDTRPTRLDYDRCYQGAIETNANLVKRGYDKFLSSPEYSDAFKQNLQQKRQAQWNNIVATCGNSAPCIEKSLWNWQTVVNSEWAKDHRR